MKNEEVYFLSTFINLTYEEKELNKIEQLANEFLKDQTSDDYPFYINEVGLSRADQRLNAKQANKTKVTNIDKRNNEVIKDYEELSTMIKSRDDRICRKTLSDVRKDQIDVKNRHVIHFKHLTEDSEDIQFDLFSFEDEEQVEALLMFSPSSNLSTWRGCIYESIIDYLVPTDALKLIWEGYTEEEIGEKLGVSRQAIRASIERSVRQLIKRYKAAKLDWIYTYKFKGNYKKCNKCSQNKLHFNFTKDTSKKDGLKTICKDCA